ncbi:MAG: hypothetical protein ACK4M7_10475, partial [Burkholderiales bacterium]
GSVLNATWYVTHIQTAGINSLSMVLESFTSLTLYLALAGILTAWIFYRQPELATKLVSAIKPLYLILERNYFMDDLYIRVLAPLGRGIGRFLWQISDVVIIDGLLVNGSAKVVAWYSKLLQRLQSGYVNTYATFMILGIILLLTFCTRLIFS